MEKEQIGERGDNGRTGRPQILPWRLRASPLQTEGLLSVPGHLTLLSSSSGRGDRDSSGHPKNEPYEVQCVPRTQARSWGGE